VPKRVPHRGRRIEARASRPWRRPGAGGPPRLVAASGL